MWSPSVCSEYYATHAKDRCLRQSGDDPVSDVCVGDGHVSSMYWRRDISVDIAAVSELVAHGIAAKVIAS